MNKFKIGDKVTPVWSDPLPFVYRNQSCVNENSIGIIKELLDSLIKVEWNNIPHMYVYMAYDEIQPYEEDEEEEEEIKIETFNSLAHNDANYLLAKAHIELWEKGLTSPSSFPVIENFGIVASINGKNIGVMSYNFIMSDSISLDDSDEIEDKKDVWIYTSYVLPKYRNLGVYKKMFDKMIEIAKENDCDFIKAGTHRDNKEMMELVMKHRRLSNEVVEYEYEVKNEN